MYGNVAGEQEGNAKSKREAGGTDKEASDAVVGGIMVIVKTANRKIRD